MLREPDGYATPASARVQKKWEPIVTAFMEGHIETLCSIQRTGARGRIFGCLIAEMWKVMGVSYRAEPLFEHRTPNPWYVAFAARYDLKLRTHPFYNPDFVLADGAWVEATLSENTAYAKLFRYGHQAARLRVVWLDEDTGLHKTLCAREAFPNAEVVSISSFYSPLSACERGDGLVSNFEKLRMLKGVLL